MNQPPKLMVTAGVILKATGLTSKDLEKMRRDNLNFWEQVNGKKGYRYDINLIPEILKKKENE